MHPFMQAACIAYNGHVPLVLKPDVIWMTILQGFAADVNKKSERKKKSQKLRKSETCKKTKKKIVQNDSLNLCHLNFFFS